jgi:hypothetical protein
MRAKLFKHTPQGPTNVQKIGDIENSTTIYLPMLTICVTAHRIIGTKATWFQIDAVHLNVGETYIRPGMRVLAPAAWNGTATTRRLLYRDDVETSDVKVLEICFDDENVAYLRFCLNSISVERQHSRPVNEGQMQGNLELSTSNLLSNNVSTAMETERNTPLTSNRT